VTPYQRGNRDGLLSFADELDAMADDYRKRADKPAHPQANPYAVQRLRDTDLWRMQVAKHAADRARRLSEALPEDPTP